MNSVHWTRKAVKQLLKLHSVHQGKVRDAVTALADMPDVGNVKALVMTTLTDCVSAIIESCSTGMAQSKWSVFKRSKNVMNAPTDIQIINDAEGNPAFVVIPYAQYVAQKIQPDLIPHEVVSRIVDGATPIRAWREHLNLTQEEVAKRMGISQPAFAQQETVAKPRKATREKIAAAFGITASQLEL